MKIYLQESAEDEDPLLPSPLQNQDEEEDIVPTQFQLHRLHEDFEFDKARDDNDVASDYDDEEFNNDIHKYDWNSDRNNRQLGRLILIAALFLCSI